jgi:hypothetical protein
VAAPLVEFERKELAGNIGEILALSAKKWNWPSS